MRKNNIIFLFSTIIFLFCCNLQSEAQTFDWRHIARGADTAEIYITCAWYQDNQEWWGAIFRSTDNGTSFSVQNKYIYPDHIHEIFGDSTQGVLFQYPFTYGIGISFDYGVTFEGKPVPLTNYVAGIGGCLKGEFYAQGHLSDTIKGLYHLTNFGDTLTLVNTHFNSITTREAGSLPGEVYGIQWPYFGSQSDTLGLALSIDTGKTFTVNYLDTSIVAYLQQHTLSSGPAPGELYLSAWGGGSWTYHILHSYDYGQTFEVKYSFPFDPMWYEYSFVAGRLPGTFYIFEEGICSTFPLHNCITIYFSRDYGATYTAYFHELDSTYTGVPEPPPLEGTFSVYPNPTTDKLKVEFKGVSEDCDVELLDPMGKLITKKPRLPGERSVVITVGTLPKGVYILRIRHGDRIIGMEKVVMTIAGK